MRIYSSTLQEYIIKGKNIMHNDIIPQDEVQTGFILNLEGDLAKIRVAPNADCDNCGTCEIKHMEMPGMTRVFVVKDRALLDKTTVGARILFMATNENGQMTASDIQPAK